MFMGRGKMNAIITQPLVLKKKSRSSRFSGWSGEANTFRDKVLRGLYIFLLFAMDFVMFIYSVNGRLYENGQINSAVVAILGSAFALSILSIFCLFFSAGFQNAVCAFCTMIFTVMFFYQFGVGNVDGFLDDWFDKNASWLKFICVMPTPWLVGLVLGMLVFVLFQFSDVILFVNLILLFSCGIGIQKNEFIHPSYAEHEEIKLLPESAGETRENNVIYMMLPKLPSYLLLSNIKDSNFRELRDLLIGFYAANGFEVYPNAFVRKPDTMSNIIDILNQIDYNSATSAHRGYASFVNDWNFIHGGLDVLSLEENRLYNFLHKNGFGVSIYAMPGFNFCLTSGDFLTDRCVIKGYKTVSLYDPKAPLMQNVYALLGEWILSIKSQDLNGLAKVMIDQSPLKGMKVLSENRRTSIEGSADIFAKLSSDYKRDIDGQFYLAYVDMPSDIYIYDEFCNIKPRSEWLALSDNTLYRGGIDEKRKAYVDQAKCLIGKMQEYMDNIKNNEKIARTDIYIQGVSPIRELAGVMSDQYSRFVSDHLVNLAVRRGKNPKFLINSNICLASDFTKSFMYYQNYCYSLDNMRGYTKAEIFDLKRNLINNSIIRNSRLSNVIGSYQDWYDMYKANSKSYLKKHQLLKQEWLIKQQQGRLLEEKEDNLNAFDDNISLGTDEQNQDENIFVPTDDFDVDVEKDVHPDEEKPVAFEAKVPVVVQEPEKVNPEVDKNNEKAADEAPKEAVKDDIKPVKADEPQKKADTPQQKNEKIPAKADDDELELDFF